jgi:hypothetical protein
MEMEDLCNIRGISSQCKDDRHVLFWDFDHISMRNYNKLIDDIKETQELYHLSDVYFFETLHGYHGICLDKYSLDDAYRIYCNLNFADKKHRKWGYSKWKHWVLRVSIDKDIKFLYPIRSRYNQKLKSNAHRVFFNLAYNMDIKHDLFFDQTESVFLEWWKKYDTVV